MGASLEPPVPPDRGPEPEPSIPSRLVYAILGAVAGGACGVCAMGRSNSPDLSGTEPLYIFALLMLTGGLIGLELHATRHWSRFGHWGTLGRWVLAFVGTTATVGSIFLLMGGITTDDYYFALGSMSVFGLVCGLQIVRADHDLAKSSNPKRDSSKAYREATSAADARSRFVWVDNKGAVRELTETECEYLATPFRPFDGGRPYVKPDYNSRTPDNRLQGFLERRHVPRKLKRGS